MARASPDYLEKELEEGGAMHGSTVSDADSEELHRQRRTLFANYGLACIMPDKKKAYLYCLFGTKNWAKVDMAEARAVSFSSEAPELPDSVAIAF